MASNSPDTTCANNSSLCSFNGLTLLVGFAFAWGCLWGCLDLEFVFAVLLSDADGSPVAFSGRGLFGPNFPPFLPNLGLRGRLDSPELSTELFSETTPFSVVAKSF